MHGCNCTGDGYILSWSCESESASRRYWTKMKWEVGEEEVRRREGEEEERRREGEEEARRRRGGEKERRKGGEEERRRGVS